MEAVKRGQLIEELHSCVYSNEWVESVLHTYWLSTFNKYEITRILSELVAINSWS
jgi:hypothetical protein